MALLYEDLETFPPKGQTEQMCLLQIKRVFPPLLEPGPGLDFQNSRSGNDSAGEAETLLDDLHSLFQRLHPVLKLAVRKLHEGAGLKEFVLHACRQPVDSLMKSLVPFDDQINSVSMS